MLTFSERLQFWCHCQRQQGDAWTPRELERASGINRGHWHHWLTASVRIAAGEKLPPSRQGPTDDQWQTIFASLALPESFKSEFADKRPGADGVVGLGSRQPAVKANRECLWCGRPFYSAYAEGYCGDEHYGKMMGYRRKLRRDLRQTTRHERQQKRQAG
jgi:hypothetical protein